MKWIFVGLGNPGGEYAITRHNTGRIVLEEVRCTYGMEDWEAKKSHQALATKGEIGGSEALLIEPETMMNNSGKSLVSLVKSKKQAAQTVVVYDDMDLPLGKWKISFNRGSGGHKGVESIARSLKTKEFVRIRVGISPMSMFGKMKKPHGEDAVVKFILGKFSDSEMKELRRVAKEVAQGIETLLTQGLEIAMGEWNSK